MELTTQDPYGGLHKGTRWSKEFSTSKAVRIIVGVFRSTGIREDDLVIWTTNRNGTADRRPYSGRRASFNHWVPAKPVQFEVGHTYTQVLSSVSFEDRRTYRVLHMFGDGEKAGQVIALDDLEQIAELVQSERELYRDVTGEQS